MQTRSSLTNPVVGRRRCLAMLGASALWLSGCSKEAPLNVDGVDVSKANFGRHFALTDPSGKARTLEEFKGSVVMVFFGFTQCPDICPTALVRATDIRRLLGEDGKRLQVIFITLDPERDTPPVLDAYTKAFDPEFLGLYGDLARTKETADEFRVFYQKVETGNSYTLDHTSLSYVYDVDGRLRLLLKHEQTAQSCAHDIQKIIDRKTA